MNSGYILPSIFNLNEEEKVNLSQCNVYCMFCSHPLSFRNQDFSIVPAKPLPTGIFDEVIYIYIYIYFFFYLFSKIFFSFLGHS